MSAEPMKLAQALVHDLRASLHGLSLALEMVREELPRDENGKSSRYLDLASAEAAALDRTVEELGLWVRILGGHFRPRPERVDLRGALAERVNVMTELPDGPVAIMADRQMLAPALNGIEDFVRACSIPSDEPRVLLTENAHLVMRGPQHWRPVFETVVSSPVPDLQSAKGPAKWLVGLALAVAVCRASGGEVHLELHENRCHLHFRWIQAE